MIVGKIGSVKTDCIPGRILVWLDLGGGRGPVGEVLEIQFAAEFQLAVFFQEHICGDQAIETKKAQGPPGRNGARWP
jgi:hypothetical protein